MDMEYLVWFSVPLAAGRCDIGGWSVVFDDIHSLPDSLRLVVQFASMFLVFQEVGLIVSPELLEGLSVAGVAKACLILFAAMLVAIGGTNICKLSILKTRKLE